MGFSIESPDLQAMEAHMKTVDPGKAAARAIFDLGHHGLTDELKLALRQAGGGPELVDEITVHKHQGGVYIGVPPTSPHFSQARDLEYGTLVGAPRGWLRGTVARHQHTLNDAFASCLTQRFFGVRA